MPTRDEWNARARAAHEFTAARQGSRKVLIVVAAQHPLIDGTRPGPEFEARLLRGRDLALRYREDHHQVEIYVPGSRHMHDGVADEISLAAAGTNFLDSQKLPDDILVHGVDLNRQYKGDQGVYNSADECYVAAQYFKECGFGQLVVVSSDVQVMREKLHYLWYGIEALVFSEPVAGAYHSLVTEAFFQIPYVRDIDPTWQDSQSELSLKSRQERRPPGKIN